MNRHLLNRCVEVSYALLPQIAWHRSTHVAFLLKNSRICYVGWNEERTHPITKKHPYRSLAYKHAELSCLLKPKKDDLSDYALAVLRIDRNNQINQSKPCLGCQSVIEQLGVSRVMYTEANGEWNEAD